LAEHGFPLIGGRVDYLDGRPVAALVYQRRKHIIDLFIWPAESVHSRASDGMKGYNVIRWNHGGMAFVAVSDLNNTELQRFQELLPKS
jgi:anti-sigma factor RsiW